jgi:hypothetical protein
MRKVVTVRLEEGVVEDLRGWAGESGRSLANLLEWWWKVEKERREGHQVTLEILDEKLDRLLMTKAKVKSAPRLTAEDVEVEGIVEREAWLKWVRHLHGCGVHLNYYMGELEKRRLQALSEEDWDCELLIDTLIAMRAKSIYLPMDWTRKR